MAMCQLAIYLTLPIHIDFPSHVCRIGGGLPVDCRAEMAGPWDGNTGCVGCTGGVVPKAGEDERKGRGGNGREGREGKEERDWG